MDVQDPVDCGSTKTLCSWTSRGPVADGHTGQISFDQAQAQVPSDLTYKTQIQRENH